MNYEVCKGNTNTTLGIVYNGFVTTFTVEKNGAEDCTLVLCPKDGGRYERIPMQRAGNQTSIYTVGLKHLSRKNYDYIYEAEGKTFLDPYAKKIVGREQWGDINRKRENVKCGFHNEERFQWNEDELPGILKQDMVMYKLHVRGFSMLQKLSDKEKGTFRGVEKKLQYLKNLGITTVEFMPIYEFEEIFAQDSFQHEIFPPDKINYWGYTRGNYFAVKASYLGEGNTAKALKQLVRSMHRSGMECILEFYFDDKLNPHYILDVLHYWAEEYHVDGFHVICDSGVAELIARDYRLNGRKLFFDWFPEGLCEPERSEMQLYSYNDAFSYSVRKIMNHQGGTIQEFADNLRRQQKNQGFVNYLATNNGFNLHDMFAYSQKHNQNNGEENKDGIAWNFSDNCGEEGPSKKKQVNRLRERKMKNALCALLFGQGIPLIWMGDECGNSQMGNNNPYCQDNEIGWKCWDMTKRSRELVQFFQKLVEIRQKYPILRNPIPMELSDYRRSGYPDLSYHGDSGWRMEPEGNDTGIGMMYSCEYADKDTKLNDKYIYVGYNFSTLTQSLALPALPKKYSWYYVMDTGREELFVEEILPQGAKSFELQRQTVCMLVGRREE